MAPLLLVSLLVHASAWDLLLMQNFISLECLLTARYGYVNTQSYLLIYTRKASFILKTNELHVTSFSVLEISARLLPNASVKCRVSTNHQTLTHLASTIFISGKLFSFLTRTQCLSETFRCFFKIFFVFQDAQRGVL